MKKVIGFILLILAFYSNACFAKSLQTSDIKVIESILASADVGTLVVFDVDDVLMHADDKILKSKNAAYCKELIKEFKQKKLKQEDAQREMQNLTSIILLERKISAVDPKMSSLIANLQRGNIKVLALTNCATGKFGLIPNVEDWRIAELHKHGYYFDKSWTRQKDICLKSLMQNAGDSNPVYKKGILFVDQKGEKGDVLNAFLAYFKNKPKKIIFIDDKVKNLVSVENFAKRGNIEFIGIEYTKSLEEDEGLNKDVARLQFEVLEKERKWPSDSQESELIAE